MHNKILFVKKCRFSLALLLALLMLICSISVSAASASGICGGDPGPLTTVGLHDFSKASDGGSGIYISGASGGIADGRWRASATSNQPIMSRTNHSTLASLLSGTYGGKTVDYVEFSAELSYTGTLTTSGGTFISWRSQPADATSYTQEIALNLAKASDGRLSVQCGESNTILLDRETTYKIVFGFTPAENIIRITLSGGSLGSVVLDEYVSVNALSDFSALYFRSNAFTCADAASFALYVDNVTIAHASVGDNLTWTLNGSTLSIEGEGRMMNYSAEHPAPWKDYASSITSVTFGEKVSTVGNFAFDSCALTSFTIPETIEAVGLDAFINCSKLTDVTVLSKNTEIYYDADTIPSGTTIHGYAGSIAQAYAGTYGKPFVKIPTKGMTTLISLDTAEMTHSGKFDTVHPIDSNFSWQLGGSSNFRERTVGGYTGTVMYMAPGMFVINDINGILADYEAVSVSFDLCFESFPDASSAANPARDDFKPQSVLCWLGSSYDGIRIDSEGNLYSNTTTSSKLDVTLETNQWYSIKLVYSLSIQKLELWINGERVSIAPCYPRNVSESIRLFDASTTYTVDLKNIEIAATEEFYYCGMEKEDSSDFISYQTTKPDGEGRFNLRVLAGINSIDYKSFGYRVLLLTKDGAVRELTGTDDKVYSAVHGGETEYSIKENFGYEYTCLATITNLDANSDFTELVIFPYTISMDGDKLYGTPMSLTYTGETNANGFPLLRESNQAIDLTPSDDTYINEAYNSTSYGTDQSFIIRNSGSYSSDWYRAAYFKFHIPANVVAELDQMTEITLRIYVNNILSQSGRQKYDMNVYKVTKTWDEASATYNTFYKFNFSDLLGGYKNSRGDVIDTVKAEDYYAGSYLNFNVLDYVKEQTPNSDGSIDVSFCVTQPDGHRDATEVYLSSKEAGENAPTLHFEKTIYGHSISNTKTANDGYEPLSYAETLVNEWFYSLRDKIYPKDENGNLIYHDELGDFAPTGYGASAAAGDFTEKTEWKNSSIWASSADADGNYIVDGSAWRADKFARTLSTLGTSTANAFLNSSYADTTSEYDIYGGITNAGFTGRATGFFHTERVGERTYIIDPLGNPYFAVSVNQLNLGDTANQKTESIAEYGTEEDYFNAITASLKDIGINTAFVSDDTALLGVENGLSVVVGVSGIGSYMAKLGRTQVKEGVYPYNNTLNLFDPDFAKVINARNKELIEKNGYADNKNILAYSADNELPAGDTILERYLTLDPDVYENAFSYHTAWTWLAKRMNTLNPTLEEYQNSSEKQAINSEFLSFLYSTYYKTVRASIEAADKNHMYLGSRAFDTCKTDEGYLRAAGYHLDLITINLYDGLNPSATTISNIYKYSGKPFIVTEFFAKGMDAIDANGYKLANSTGAGILVYTQKDRANYYENYVLNLLESKACVGWSWYRFRDNDQSLYTATKDGKTLTDLRMLYVYYSNDSYPITLMDKDGNVYAASDLGITQSNWKSTLTQTYKGEALASNQNVNKGIFNSNFSSVVTVYSYNADGTLNTSSDPYTFGSKAFEVEDPASAILADGTVLTSKDGLTGFTIGTQTNADGSYTETVLTVYKGMYLPLSDSIKNVSDHLMGIVNYFDAN